MIVNPELPLHILFLPGMMCDEHLFEAQIESLTDTCETRVACFDKGDSIEAFAENSLALFDHGSIVLVGLSMGGIVAMECLRQQPDRIQAVVLMDCNPLSELPERQTLRERQIERVLAGELDKILIDEMKPLYLAPENRENESILQGVLEMARRLGPEVFVRQSRALARRRDYSATLRHWRGSTLLLCGENDALCPPDRHRYMQGLMPQSRLEILPRAGHLPTMEIPAQVNALLGDFLVRTERLKR